MTVNSTGNDKSDFAGSDSFYRALDSAPIATFVVNDNNAIEFVNLAATELFGLSQSAAENQHLTCCIKSTESEPVFAGPESTGNKSDHSNWQTGVGIHSNNGEFHIEFRFRPFSIGEKTFKVINVVSVAPQNQLEEELKRSQLEVSRLQNELTSFTSIASHELQAPLRRTNSFMALIVKGYQSILDEKGGDWLKRCTENLNHMQSLISDLALYSEISNRIIHKTKCDLGAILEMATSDLVTREFPKAKVETPGPMPTIAGDPELLQTLFSQLLKNSFTYTQQDSPCVEVSCSKKAGFWEILIVDEGIGIEASYHARVFEMFKRLHSDKNIPGNGIGLPICHMIARKHGGSLTLAEQQPKHGTMFILKLKV